MKTLSELQSEVREKITLAFLAAGEIIGTNQERVLMSISDTNVALAYQAGKDAAVEKIQQHASYKLEKVRRRNENVGGFEIISEKQYQIPEWVLEEARNTN